MFKGRDGFHFEFFILGFLILNKIYRSYIIQIKRQHVVHYCYNVFCRSPHLPGTCARALTLDLNFLLLFSVFTIFLYQGKQWWMIKVMLVIIYLISYYFDLITKWLEGIFPAMLQLLCMMKSILKDLICYM